MDAPLNFGLTYPPVCATVARLSNDTPNLVSKASFLTALTDLPFPQSSPSWWQCQPSGCSGPSPSVPLDLPPLHYTFRLPALSLKHSRASHFIQISQNPSTKKTFKWAINKKKSPVLFKRERQTKITMKKGSTLSEWLKLKKG